MINRRPIARGFTLMELLVVIGLLDGLSVVIARSFAVSDSSRLREAEAVVGSLLRAARAEAFSGTRSRLLVLANPTSPEHMARLAVVANDGAGNWVLYREPISLPTQVRIVPESGAQTSGPSWPAAAASAFSGTATLTLPGETSATYHYIEFTESGSTTSGRKLVVALTRQNSTTLDFLPAENARAFILRPTGAFVVVKQVDAL